MAFFLCVSVVSFVTVKLPKALLPSFICLGLPKNG